MSSFSVFPTLAGHVSSRAGSAPTPAPAPSPSRGLRGGRGVHKLDTTTADTHHRAAVIPRAHRNSARSRRPPQSDDLVTPQGRYPEAWATDLADIFGWDDVLDASGVGDGDGVAKQINNESSSRQILLPKRIALDGANIAWSLGTSIRSRFKCRQFPLSAGVVQALNYESWIQKNFDVVAFLPKEYVVGGLQTICDGGGRATLNAEVVKYICKGIWVNQRLMDLVDQGRIIMVDRNAVSEKQFVKASDDLTIIEYAKERDAWICSNDQFRDHRRNRSLGFSGARDLKAFARMRRFEHSFRVAPGLDDGLLESMRNASRWEPQIGWQTATTVSGGKVPPPRPKKNDGNKNKNNAADNDAMGAVMDSLMRSTSGISTSNDSNAPSEDLYYDGPRTRNDNENALGGIPPFYAMPQEILPTFFEPNPTQPMIAARKSFLNRQGWQVQTLSSRK